MSKLHPRDREVLDNFTGMTVGQIFVRARGNLGYSLEQIGSHLNIGTMHLQAIEADDTGNLPPKVYAVGFVRAYADVLGLDSEKMAYLFKMQSYGHSLEQQENIVNQGGMVGIKDTWANYLDVFSSRIGFLLFVIISMSVMCVVIATTVWLVWPREQQSDTAGIIPPVPVEMMESVTIEPPVIEAFEESIKLSPAELIDLIVKPGAGGAVFGGEATSSALVFKAVDTSWVEIRAVDNNRILLSRTLNQGDVFYTPEDIDILLTTGNAAGLEVYLDGASLGVMGVHGQIIRMRPLSVAALRLQNAPETE